MSVVYKKGKKENFKFLFTSAAKWAAKKPELALAHKPFITPHLLPAVFQRALWKHSLTCKTPHINLIPNKTNMSLIRL